MSTFDQYIAKNFGTAFIRFFHAENLRNFRTYCSAKALLCREELAARDNEFTRFYSDDLDQRLGAFNRVFGNIYDFGSIFARASKNTIPNIYGPILLRFKQACFTSMSDICITPQSIASLKDEWRQKSIKNEQELDKIMTGRRPSDVIIPEWRYAEISCAENSLSFDFLENITVEPVAICGVRLVNIVQQLIDECGIECKIEERDYESNESRNTLRDMASICDGFPFDYENAEWSFPDERLPAAFSSHSSEQRNRVCGWFRYFFLGTTAEIRRDLDKVEDCDDDRTNCELCDPGRDHPPAMVNYRSWLAENETEPRAELGRCDWCNGISVRCKDCGEIKTLYESEYNQPVDCPGGCGLEFMIESSYNHRDGSGCEYLVILDADPQ